MMKQLSVFVENKPGSLMRVTSELNEANVSIKAISSFDTPDFGILRMIVDDIQTAKKCLEANGMLARIQSIVAVELEDKKGALNSLLNILYDNNININYIYSMVIRDGKMPLMILYSEENEKMESVLNKHSFKIVDNL